MIKTYDGNGRMALKPLMHQTKTQALRDELSSLVDTMQPDEKLPTMRQLQESLGVSPMTLHRALSELEAQHIIYRRQGSGTYVAPRAEAPAEATPTVGLVYDRDIFGKQASPFGSILVEEARRRATANGERFSLYLAPKSSEDEAVHDDLREAVEQGRLRGVLYAGETHVRALDYLLENNIPVVSLSYLPTASHRVRIDHAEIVRLGVQALAEKGCKRIGLWIPLGVGLGKDSTGHFSELDAFRGALKEHGLEYDETLVWRADEHTSEVPEVAETNQHQGLRAAREVFAKKKGDSSTRNVPDGIVINDDMMTRGALTSLAKLGVPIGKDLQIATHANCHSDVLLGHEDDLTLIEIDPAQVADAMFQMLETLMSGNQPVSDVVEIKPQLRN